MTELTVISGKGGTGKTSLVASFATLVQNKVLADCDVDASDLPLILNPEIHYSEDFSGGNKAHIITEKCTNCGICFDVCRFEAVKQYSNGKSNCISEHQISATACEGCGVCNRACPEEAIAFEPAVNGKWFISRTRYGPMVHARLGPAEENSGKLVTLVRDQAKKVAQKNGLNLIIVDGSPGIGCPVIASVTGTNMVLVVTEPTLSGIHDLERVASLAAHFNIPTVVCINKWDINPQLSLRIEEEARSMGLKVVGKIRYDESFTKAQIMGASVVEYTGGAVAEDIKSLWRHITYELI